MGTRADFYIGRGKQSEWLGSVAWDGYPSGIATTENVTTCPLLNAKDAEAFRTEVSVEFGRREDATLPAQGWPWPWETSHTTDYAYAFDAGKVWASCFGHPWFDPTILRAQDEQEANEEEAKGPSPEFPDMTKQQKVTLGKRSGVMIFGR